MEFLRKFAKFRRDAQSTVSRAGRNGGSGPVTQDADCANAVSGRTVHAVLDAAGPGTYQSSDFVWP